MSAKNPAGIFIPSVFIGEEAGSVLKESYQYNTSYFVLINDEEPFNISTHLLVPFAIVVGICSLIMVVFMVSLQSFRMYVFQ
jgi:E3 ubiquitin-protein ligase RNF13